MRFVLEHARKFKALVLFAGLLILFLAGVIPMGIRDRSALKTLVAEHTDVELEQEILKRSRPLQVMRFRFAKEYRTLLRAILKEDMQAAGTGEIVADVRSQIAAFRRSQARYILFAPPNSIKDVLAANEKVYRKAVEIDGYELCNNLVVNGPAPPTNVAKRMRTELDEQDALILEAIYQGRNHHVRVGDAGASDWGAVVHRMSQEGAASHLAASIVRGEREDPNLCAAFSVLLDTLSTLDDEPSWRVGASLVRKLAEN